MDKKLSYYISAYKTQLISGDIQIAYEKLLRYLMFLKTHCEKVFINEYSFGHISPGYMDFSYFPFFNDFLKTEKLRFGIVLNHKKLRFELWLFGQNKNIQKHYWNILKSSIWNKNLLNKPKYAVLETILVEDPDFDNIDKLTTEIERNARSQIEKIISYIKSIKK